MCSCIVDQAQVTEELLLELSLQKQREEAQKVVALGPAGVCLNCGNREIPSEARYCDADCREDHDKRLKARQRSGRI